jgi:uncharacterized membrane protein
VHCPLHLKSRRHGDVSRAKKERPPLGPLSILHEIYSLAIAVALALTTLMLTAAAVLATLARALALLVGIVSPALLLAGLLLAALMLLSALIRIIRHD